MVSYANPPLHVHYVTMRGQILPDEIAWQRDESGANSAEPNCKIIKKNVKNERSYKDNLLPRVIRLYVIRRIICVTSFLRSRLGPVSFWRFW